MLDELNGTQNIGNFDGTTQEFLGKFRSKNASKIKTDIEHIVAERRNDLV